jgi:hypothetical protein
VQDQQIDWKWNDGDIWQWYIPTIRLPSLP